MIPFTDLQKLDLDFQNSLSQELLAQLKTYRASLQIPNTDFLNELAYSLEEFIAKTLNIEQAVSALQKQDNRYINLHKCQRNFTQRRLASSNESSTDVQIHNISESLFNSSFPVPEEVFADKVIDWLEDEERYKNEILEAEKYARYMLSHNSACNTNSIFSYQKNIDYEHLVKPAQVSQRDGFDLTDSGCPSSFAIKEASYCLYCHHRKKDSCSIGLYQKGKISKNPLGNILNGCPLEQKISEMNEAKAKGYSIAALAIITMDNPLVAATGHRICNDCKKSCIFQKQEPVEIPQIETKILRDVLSLPCGEEIYELLTRWNPLKAEDYLLKESNGKKILIVGMGPAGFSLAYYLLREGCSVTAIDGNYKFGGVAEYGITARWDKRFLNIIEKIIRNYGNFSFHPGVRFGSNITYEQALALGFQKIAICTGAGAPKVLDIKNSTAKGIRAASDFLMSINRYDKSKGLLPNIIIRMPIAIIGGGLSAIDAATESLAYYKIQVQEFAKKYLALETKLGKDFILNLLNAEEKLIAAEFLKHAKELSRSNNHISLLQKWGGASIYYHKDTTKSQAYVINHEELQYALNEGVEFIHQHEALEVITDEFNSANAIKFLDYKTGSEVITPAKTILYALGIEQKSIPQNNNIYIFGDADSTYAGSVVKAIASVKNGYKKLLQDTSCTEERTLTRQEKTLTPRLLSVESIKDNLIKFVIKSDLASANFHPGQFFKLQNMKSEFAALNVSEIDKTSGTMSFIMQVRGSATKSLAELKAGDEILLIGPLGDYIPIDEADKNVILIGQGIANIGLHEIGKAYMQAGAYVRHIGIFNKESEIFLKEMFACSSNEFEFVKTFESLETALMNLSVDSLVITAIYPDAMKIVKRILKEQKIISAVHSLMQCMMGGVCGSCVQKTKDSYTYTCANQYQNLESLDIEHLKNKLEQNSLIEKILQI